MGIKFSHLPVLSDPAPNDYVAVFDTSESVVKRASLATIGSGGTGGSGNMSTEVYDKNHNDCIDVDAGGTGLKSIPTGTVLVGNGANTPTTRVIDNTTGGTAGSEALITSGAVKTKFTQIESSFQDGVDTIKNALTNIGATPTASTPSAIAATIASVGSGTAAAGDILTGKTAYGSKKMLSGSMVNRGAVTSSLNPGGTYTIPQGYHNGSGKVTANSNSGTYTFGATSGGTVDMGLNNTYRYANASNVYTTGVNAGGAAKKSLALAHFNNVYTPILTNLDKIGGRSSNRYDKTWRATDKADVQSWINTIVQALANLNSALNNM